jgi:hypothetical protein
MMYTLSFNAVYYNLSLKTSREYLPTLGAPRRQLITAYDSACFARHNNFTILNLKTSFG